MTTRWLSVARLPPEALAAAAIAGEPGAIDELARAWLPHVYRWAHRLGGPGFDAEDAAHEVLVILCRRVRSIREPGALPSWLYGATRRVLANHRRRAWWKRWLPGAVVPEQVDDAYTPLDHAQASQAHRRVWHALSELSESHRDVLVLCDLEERSSSEAAELLSIPLGTVKSRLRAARIAFRTAVETADARALRTAGALP